MSPDYPGIPAAALLAGWKIVTVSASGSEHPPRTGSQCGGCATGDDDGGDGGQSQWRLLVAAEHDLGKE